MKGYWFYLDYGDAATKRKARSHGAKRRHANDTPNEGGNCIAVFTQPDGHRAHWSPQCLYGSRRYACLAATFFHANSDTASDGVSSEYLRKACSRITEAEARRIHPRLMSRIDANEAVGGCFENNCKHKGGGGV